MAKKKPIETIHHKYTQLFSTPLGKEILKDLQKVWKSPPQDLSTGSLAFLEGQRHVLRYIENYVEKGRK